MKLAIQANIKDFFFDRKAIQDRIEPATKKNLSKGGAIVRRRARSSIKFRADPKGVSRTKTGKIRKRRKYRSAAGQPPYSHTKPGIRKILFGFDPLRESVLVGPAYFPAKTKGAPSALEYGGVVRVRTRRTKRSRGGYKNVRIAPRPTMQLAMKNAAPDLPPLWANTVKG